MINEPRIFKKSRYKDFNYCTVNGKHELVKNTGKCIKCNTLTNEEKCPNCGKCASCGRSLKE